MNAHIPFPAMVRLGLLGVLLAAAPHAFGQMKVKIEAQNPKFDDLESPVVGGNTERKTWKQEDWLEVEVKVRIDARPAPKDGYIDELQVKWFVAVENKTGERGTAKYFLMEKDITHVNVPVGEDFYLSVYLSPATIRRLTGSKRAGKGVVWGVGGEITCEGAVKPARFSSKALNDKDPWWGSSKLQRTQKFPLRNKNETPFKFLWWDRYLEIKSDRG